MITAKLAFKLNILFVIFLANRYTVATSKNFKNLLSKHDLFGKSLLYFHRSMFSVNKYFVLNGHVIEQNCHATDNILQTLWRLFGSPCQYQLSKFLMFLADNITYISSFGDVFRSNFAEAR